MWCLCSCVEPVIQLCQGPGARTTHPVCADSSEVPVLCVEEAGQPRDVLLGPRRSSWGRRGVKVSDAQLPVLPDYKFHLYNTVIKYTKTKTNTKFHICHLFVTCVFYLFWLHNADDIIGPVANTKDGVKPEIM